MKYLVCLIELSEDGLILPDDIEIVCCYPSHAEAEHMKKENEKENPDSKYILQQTLLAEKGEVVLNAKDNHCGHCGAFLKSEPDDTMQDGSLTTVTKVCKKCGFANNIHV